MAVFLTYSGLKKMLVKLWTVRPERDYVLLCENGRYITDKKFVDPYWLNAYHWISDQLAQCVARPEGVVLPMWAWYLAHGKRRPKLDLRRSAHLNSKQKGVRIEFEIPADQVLFSDFEAWHIVLNDYYLAEDDAEYAYLEQLKKKVSVDEFDRIKRKSWEKIFDLSLIRDIENSAIQAIFGELKLEWVRKVDFFIAR